ncbi:MAG: tyrosine-type recombinase/integrase [Candidatus Baltobacteraceae bacterium]
MRREVLSRNVALLVGEDDLPKATRPKPLALTKDELQTLLDEAKTPTSRSKKRRYLSSHPWFYPAVSFAAYIGCRRGEILALRWNDVHFDAKSVTMERSVTETLRFKAPKNDRSRTISISETLCSILHTHKATQAKERLFAGAGYKDGDLVVAHGNGEPINPWNFGRAVRD